MPWRLHPAEQAGADRHRWCRQRSVVVSVDSYQGLPESAGSRGTMRSRDRPCPHRRRRRRSGAVGVGSRSRARRAASLGRSRAGRRFCRRGRGASRCAGRGRGTCLRSGGARPTPRIRICGAPSRCAHSHPPTVAAGAAARCLAREAPRTDGRVEPPPHRSGPRVEGEERAPAAGGLTGRASVDEAVRDERRDRDRVPRPRQPAPPSLAPVRAESAKASCRCCRRRHRSPPRRRSAHRPGCGTGGARVGGRRRADGVDVAVQVLEVHPARRHDRRRRVDAGEARAPREAGNANDTRAGRRRRAPTGRVPPACSRRSRSAGTSPSGRPASTHPRRRSRRARRGRATRRGRSVDAIRHRQGAAYSPSPEITAMRPRMTRGSQLRAQRYP